MRLHPPAAASRSLFRLTTVRLLHEAIESVLPSPLIESPDQIVVVDDDSRDGTSAVVRELGVKSVRVTCRSAAGSRNAGLALIQTPYVAFLDDDDRWLPGNMEPQLAALAASPAAGFAYGIAQPVSEDLEPINHCFPSPPLASGLAPEQLHQAYPQLGVVLFRRDALAEVGGFDRRIRYYEDGDLMLRIAARHEIIGVESVGMLYRERPASRARADYFWADARREIIRWTPKQVGVAWRTATKYQFKMRGLFFGRFCDDASASLEDGHRQDALICLSRALRISPAHALRHSRRLGTILSQSIGRRHLYQAWQREALMTAGEHPGPTST
jgi:glycosyltransferase involved in cell wall biosynthesis